MIPTFELSSQLDTLEDLAARRIAAAALGVDWNYRDAVAEEMNNRLRLAFGLIDNFQGDDEDCNANGVNTCTCRSCNPASPCVDNGEIPY